jgi:hypothetical protein
MFLVLAFLVFSAAPCHSPTVNSLTVKITTRDLRGAGTDNAAYFDVGPWSWRLNNAWHNDFEASHTDTFHLDVPTGFTTEDIVWLRLHKKGLFGVTGTRDGLTGAWRPERIALFVNGVECLSSEVTQPLNSRYWFWTSTRFDPYSDATNFARTLRLKPNDKLDWVAKSTGFFTTRLFKKRGISGWLNCPEEKQPMATEMPCASLPEVACASGQVYRSPAVSNDGLATIDLVLETLEFCSATSSRQSRAEMREASHQTYLRVEYPHRKKPIPKKDEYVRICGKLRWDTDLEGWWEIHPQPGSYIKLVNGKN